jgi:hypothetical protein
MKTLQLAGVNTPHLQEAKDIASAYLDPINGVFGQMDAQQGGQSFMRLSLSGDCTKFLDDRQDAKGFRDCLATTDSPKLQRLTITTTLGYKDDNKDASANSVVDTTAGQIDHRNYLPDPSVNELPEGKSATSVKLNTHFPAAFGKNSSITAQIIASTSADPNKVFLQKKTTSPQFTSIKILCCFVQCSKFIYQLALATATVSNNR